MVENFGKNPMNWCKYIDEIFFIDEHGEESEKIHKDQSNMLHPTIKLTVEYSKEEGKF